MAENKKRDAETYGEKYSRRQSWSDPNISEDEN